MNRRRIVIGLAGAAALGGCVNGHVGRMLTLQQPDIEDYKRLPRRLVRASGAPRVLGEAADRGWQERSALAYGGLDLRAREALGSFLERSGTNAFLILSGGVIVDERYFNGYRRASLCKSFSMSKSVLAALFGIARGDGLVDEEAPVSGLLADLADSPLGAIRLRDLLSGAAGFAYQRGIWPWDDQPTMYYTRDVRGLVRRARLAHRPGSAFVEEDYSPLLLGVALEAALRKRNPSATLSDFTAQRLWGPIGAADEAYWVTDREQDGFEKTESGFVATARDLALFGQVFLDGGASGEMQVIPRDWVEQCATPPPRGAPNLFTDGYMRHFWWGKAIGDGRYDFFANGHFGQRIYIAPEKRLVLVRLGARRGGVDWTDFLGAIAQAWRSA